MKRIIKNTFIILSSYIFSSLILYGLLKNHIPDDSIDYNKIESLIKENKTEIDYDRIKSFHKEQEKIDYNKITNSISIPKIDYERISNSFKEPKDIDYNKIDSFIKENKTEIDYDRIKSFHKEQEKIDYDRLSKMIKLPEIDYVKLTEMITERLKKNKTVLEYNPDFPDIIPSVSPSL